MTSAVRSTLLVIALLAGATVAAAIGILTSPAARGGEAQDFWREIAPAPHKARRIYVTYRLRRVVARHSADRERPDARETNKSRLGTRASGSLLAHMSPSDDDVDSFSRRVVLPPPLREIYIPPNLMQRDQPLPIFSPPRERREPSNNRRRELVVVVIVVAVIGGVASKLINSQRGVLT